MALLKFFKQNVEKATTLAEELNKSFQSLNFPFSNLFLKPSDVRSFEFLFIIEKETYLSDKRKQVYKVIRSLKKDHNSDEFSFSCMLMPSSGDIKMDKVRSEGYRFQYEPKSRQA